MKADYTIVVPTINSALWIRPLYDYYKSIGTDPIFCVDAATCDDTAAILKALGARQEIVSPPHPRVESMVAMFAKLVDTEWILRIDDDECPSARLIAWIENSLQAQRDDMFSMPRRWVRFAEVKKYKIFRSRALVFQASTKWDWSLSRNGEDRQFRLYRKDKMTYISDIHTPGFEIKKRNSSILLQDYIFHFDWVLRNKQERLEKIVRYDGIKLGAGSSFKSQYIPEDEASWDYFGAIDDPKVVDLAERLRRAANRRRASWPL